MVSTEKPSKPEGPLEITDIYRDRCRLTWKSQHDDGGSPILHYAVEAQDVESEKWIEVEQVTGDTQSEVRGLEPVKAQDVESEKWVELAQVTGDTQSEVRGLEPGKRYKFRVKAVNSEGDSEPLVNNSEILAKDPYGL